MRLTNCNLVFILFISATNVASAPVSTTGFGEDPVTGISTDDATEAAINGGSSTFLPTSSQKGTVPDAQAAQKQYSASSAAKALQEANEEKDQAAIDKARADIEAKNAEGSIAYWEQALKQAQFVEDTAAIAKDREEVEAKKAELSKAINNRDAHGVISTTTVESAPVPEDLEIDTRAPFLHVGETAASAAELDQASEAILKALEEAQGESDPEKALGEFEAGNAAPPEALAAKRMQLHRASSSMA